MSCGMAGSTCEPFPPQRAVDEAVRCCVSILAHDAAACRHRGVWTGRRGAGILPHAETQRRQSSRVRAKPFSPRPWPPVIPESRPSTPRIVALTL